MHRKARLGNQMFLPYIVFIFILIIGAVVWGNYIQSSKKYDIREQDAEILLGKILECLSNNIDLKSSDLNDAFGFCNINKNTVEKGIILGIKAGEIQYFKKGDLVACGLESKNVGYARCMNSIIKIKVDGEEKELYVVVGSDLEMEKKNE